MKRLNGKVAIVTGASSGVGNGIAKVLAQDGAKVCVCARRKELLDQLVEEIKQAGGEGLAVVCDVNDPQQIHHVVEACVDAFGGVDILANLAQGSMNYKEINEVDIDYALNAYKSGPLASMLFMQACFPYLQKSGQGRIINTASAAGYDGSAGFVAYGMAKEAIRALTRHAANEWGKYGITTNAFLPIIATDNFKNSQPAALAALEKASPLQRVGSVDKDCGPFIAFLASEEGGYLNGQSFMLDGGIHKHS
ncbi:MAG: SDR family NAD(P)-dependent oxidoreductase [Erysipelotrichaceae bacterium]